MPYVDFYYCGGGAKAKPAAWIAFVRITRLLDYAVTRTKSVVAASGDGKGRLSNFLPPARQPFPCNASHVLHSQIPKDK